MVDGTVVCYMATRNKSARERLRDMSWHRRAFYGLTIVTNLLLNWICT